MEVKITLDEDGGIQITNEDGANPIQLIGLFEVAKSLIINNKHEEVQGDINDM